ncbi:hypothetical protein AYO38_05640 [bacterium SCGC AG-212-C10]|nr:hypothetical protein AYO38_05640 [bacterium SCGC AG-212-C10]
MKATKARLARLSPTLTAKERALIVLRDHKEGRPVDHSIYLAMPRNQATEFNRLLSLLRVANGALASLIVLLESRTETLETRLGWMVALRSLSLNMSDNIRATERDAEQFELRLAERFKRDFTLTWSEALAVRALLNGMSDELNGEDPLDPEFRDELDGLIESLTKLASNAALFGWEIDLPEPSEECMQGVERLVEAESKL